MDSEMPNEITPEGHSNAAIDNDDLSATFAQNRMLARLLREQRRHAKDEGARRFQELNPIAWFFDEFPNLGMNRPGFHGAPTPPSYQAGSQSHRCRSIMGLSLPGNVGAERR